MKLGKQTSAARWYDDACGTAHALELIGERWSLLIVRELMFGPRRFGELRRGLPGISANVLSQRLGGLERAGIATRTILPSPANVTVYELTPWGYESEAAIQTLGRWAARSPDHDPTLPLSPASLMLSLRTMIARDRAEGIAATIGFDLGAADRFLATLAEGGIAIVRGDPAQAEAWFAGPPETLVAAIYGGVPFAALDALRVGGDIALATRFVTLFPLPAKASIAAARASA